MNDGGPAFPMPSGWNGLTHHEEHHGNDEQEGMSLRDWFAGMALQGYLAAPDDGAIARGNPAVVAEWAYGAADAMIAERKNQS
jgi:hypothetical protein